MHIIQRKVATKALLTLGLSVVSHIASAQFMPQFIVGKGSGSFMVKRPTCEYEQGVPTKAYPYGSEITVAKDAKIFVFLSNNRQIHVGSESVFSLLNDPEAENAKRILLSSGSLETYLANEEETVYPLSVETKTAFFDDFDGRVSVQASADGCGVSVKVGIGKVTVRAPQLLPSRIGTGAHLVIRTKADGSYTELRGDSGDFALSLEHGSSEPFSAEFHAGSFAKVWRQKAPKTGTLAVSMMFANPDGSVANSYAYLEGQAPVQNGVPEKAAPSAEEATAEAAPAADATADFADFADDFSSDFSTESAPAAAPAAEPAAATDEFPSFDSFSF